MLHLNHTIVFLMTIYKTSFFFWVLYRGNYEDDRTPFTLFTTITSLSPLIPICNIHFIFHFYLEELSKEIKHMKWLRDDEHLCINLLF